VALLFAGSSTTTIGNPIGEVLSKVSTALGRTISFGGAQGTSITVLPSNSPLPQDVERAHGAKKRHEKDLMSRPGVLGVGVGGSENNGAEATVVVYFDRTSGRAPALPERVDDVRVRIVLTDPIVAY
jgi:hypothetical protein